MNAKRHEKYEKLKGILRTFDSIGIAFSGGIDSTFLLHAACKALGSGRIIALHGVSCLVPTSISRNAQEIFERHFSGIAQFRRIELRPLDWPEFVVNDQERCYWCKKKIYARFKIELEREGIPFLLDGTNADDLKAVRPGLRAIKELGVQTPLSNAGLNKPEIRELARLSGLENHNLPSNSCLATRIPTGMPIQNDTLELIFNLESFLQKKGFQDCRVRPGAEHTVVEIREDDFERIAQQDLRLSILKFFRASGIASILLDFNGRKEPEGG